MSVGDHRLNSRRAATLAALLAALALGACGSGQRSGTINEPGGPKATESKLPEGVRRTYAKGGTVQGRARVTVNRFAWQAALDAIAFMPIKTSDPYGGLIATVLDEVAERIDRYSELADAIKLGPTTYFLEPEDTQRSVDGIIEAVGALTMEAR